MWYFAGHSLGKETWIYPEEALFMMDNNQMEIKLENVAMSMQQAYDLLVRGKIICSLKPPFDQILICFPVVLRQ